MPPIRDQRASSCNSTLLVPLNNNNKITKRRQTSVAEERVSTPPQMQENSKLCELVKANPCLYDTNHRNYGKKDASEAAWKVIAGKCGQTVSCCKKRFRNLRDSYRRASNYYLHKELEFLKPFLSNERQRKVSKRQRRTIIEIVSSDETGAESTASTEIYTSRKRSVSFLDENLNTKRRLLSTSTTVGDESENAPEDTTGIVPEEASEIAPDDTTGIVPEEASENAPEDTTGIEREEASEIAPEDTTGIVPEEASENAPEDTTGIVKEEASEIAPEDTTAIEREEALEIAPENTTELMPEEASEIAPENTTEIMPEEASEIAPENTTEIMPEDGTNREPSSEVQHDISILEDKTFLNGILSVMQIMNKRQKHIYKAKIWESVHKVLDSTADYPSVSNTCAGANDARHYQNHSDTETVMQQVTLGIASLNECELREIQQHIQQRMQEIASGENCMVQIPDNNVNITKQEPTSTDSGI